MEPIELGSEAVALVGIIAALVQQFKRVPLFIEGQKYAPIFVLLSVGLGIAGAYSIQLVNPIVAGIMMGLMASGAYSITKQSNGAAKAPNGS